MNNYLIGSIVLVMLIYLSAFCYVLYRFIKLKCDFRSGSRRFVFLINDKVYKIPKFTGWVSFIRGIEENLEERYWYSADGSRKRNPKAKWNMNLPLAEIFWADRFGFIVVMERLDTLFFDYYKTSDMISERVFNDIEQLKEEVKQYSFATDVNFSNVGYRGNRMILLDYGYFGGTPDCYIGT